MQKERRDDGRPRAALGPGWHRPGGSHAAVALLGLGSCPLAPRWERLACERALGRRLAEPLRNRVRSVGEWTSLVMRVSAGRCVQEGPAPRHRWAQQDVRARVESQGLVEDAEARWASVEGWLVPGGPG
jgi:hypothetical protein